MEASNAGGVGTYHESMTAAVHDQQLTVVSAVVYNSYGAHLFTAQIANSHASVNTPKRRQENRIYLYTAVILK